MCARRTEQEDDKETRKEKVQTEEKEINNVFITSIVTKEHGGKDVETDKEIELKSGDKHDAKDEVEYKDQTMLNATRMAGEKEDGHIKVKLCVTECQEDMDTAGDLALGIPKGGGSVSAPHPIMSNDCCGQISPRPKVSRV